MMCANSPRKQRHAASVSTNSSQVTSVAPILSPQCPLLTNWVFLFLFFLACNSMFQMNWQVLERSLYLFCAWPWADMCCACWPHWQCKQQGHLSLLRLQRPAVCVSGACCHTHKHRQAQRAPVTLAGHDSRHSCHWALEAYGKCISHHHRLPGRDWNLASVSCNSIFGQFWVNKTVLHLYNCTTLYSILCCSSARLLRALVRGLILLDIEHVKQKPYDWKPVQIFHHSWPPS